MSSNSATKKKNPLLIDQQGHRECLLGNEAIVRGALESGVGFASGYPGTPSSEVTDCLAKVADAREIKFEYSVNEKIALEMAFAASLAGTRSICAMKHLGLMYAGDPLSTISYVGVVGGMVIVSAGDPSCRTSPNEQDQRHLGPMLFLPMLDPSTPQEALEMTRFAFELSEKSALPVVMRITTRVCHTSSVVRYQNLRPPKKAKFVRNPAQFTPMPMNARRMRIEIKDRLKIAQELMASAGFIRHLGHGPKIIIATGAPGGACADIIVENNLENQVSLFLSGLAYPLPEKELLAKIKNSEEILIVEELSPYLEDSIHTLCSLNKITTPIYGKRTGHLPEEFEYEPEIIEKAIYQCFGINKQVPSTPDYEPVPIRPPSLCPGCPHRSAFFAARCAFGDEHLYFNDIGCYTLGYGPPLKSVDALLCMGAGFTLAAGVSRVTGQRTVGVMGDSTFFHSGMPALLNAIKEKDNMVAVILDNEVTAMTGFQDSPFVKAKSHGPVREVSIEKLVKSLGADDVVTVDPYDLPATIAAFERAREGKGVSVVITQRACPVFVTRTTGQDHKIASFETCASSCQTCGLQAEGLRCEQNTNCQVEWHMAHGRAINKHQDQIDVGRAPCSTQCALSICIQGYIGNIATGRFQEAFEHIMSRCPLPETVCRVCHQPCATVCVRKDIDQPLAINNLKRFVINWANENNMSYQPKKNQLNGKKIAVVGAGPSGLAAAYSLRQRGFEVTIFDQQNQPGGLLNLGIPAFRLPRQALNNDIERIMKSGIEFAGQKTLGKDFTLEELLNNGYQAIYLAIGALNSIDLPLEKPNSKDLTLQIIDALEYLKQSNLGESVKTGAKVVIIGGGNSAIDAARTAIRRGASEVSIVYRRGREEMPAIEEEIEAALAENINLITMRQPIRLQIEESPGLVCLKTEFGPPDESGRRRPVPIEGSEAFIEADQIIVAIGQKIVTDTLSEPNLDMSEQQLLKIDPTTGKTSHPRIFAGGDITSNDRTVIGAIAAGLRAAWGIDKELTNQTQANTFIPPILPTPKAEVKTPPVELIKSSAKQEPNELSASIRTTNFDEVIAVYSEKQAIKEAKRCLVCGSCGNCRTCIDVFGCPAFYEEDNQILIDNSLCMGCGVCAHVCPNHAITQVDGA